VASLAERTDLQTAVAKRIFAGLRSMDRSTAEVSTDPKGMRHEVVAAIDRLVQADIVLRLTTIGAE
jgi:hypothetical protein